MFLIIFFPSYNNPYSYQVEGFVCSAICTLQDNYYLHFLFFRKIKHSYSTRCLSAQRGGSSLPDQPAPGSRQHPQLREAPFAPLLHSQNHSPVHHCRSCPLIYHEGTQHSSVLFLLRFLFAATVALGCAFAGGGSLYITGKENWVTFLVWRGWMASHLF